MTKIFFLKSEKYVWGFQIWAWNLSKGKLCKNTVGLWCRETHHVWTDTCVRDAAVRWGHAHALLTQYVWTSGQLRQYHDLFYSASDCLFLKPTNTLSSCLSQTNQWRLRALFEKSVVHSPKLTARIQSGFVQVHFAIRMMSGDEESKASLHTVTHWWAI